jgi:hypothetical protein
MERIEIEGIMSRGSMLWGFLPECGEHHVLSATPPRLWKIQSLRSHRNKPNLSTFVASIS